MSQLIKIESTAENKARSKSAVHYSSSAVFLVVNSPAKEKKTIISLLNHFLLKRNIKSVLAKVELRTLNGQLYDSYNIEISHPASYSFNPVREEGQDFVGAAYIFFQSAENLAVPFCAVTSLIESPKSVCGVHTYGRVLEEVELGGKLDAQATIESGWTLRDASQVWSFGVFHNGRSQSLIRFGLEILNSKGQTRMVEWEEPVNPWATLLIIPKNQLPDLDQFLDGLEGHAKIRIAGLQGVFPRMLCGNFRSESESLLDSDQIQFTHSNFDFSTIEQPESKKPQAYFNQPFLEAGKALTFPFKSDYAVTRGDQVFDASQINSFQITSPGQEVVQSDKALPCRLVSSSVGYWGDQVLPSECSTGVFVEEYLHNNCHWHWGLYFPNSQKVSEAVITIIKNVFSEKDQLACKVDLRLYDETGLIFQNEINLIENITLLKFSEIKRSFVGNAQGQVWYVLSGDRLEHLNVFNTIIPQEGVGGFTEHAF